MVFHTFSSPFQPPSLPLLSVQDLAPYVTQKIEAKIKGYLISPPSSPWPPSIHLSLQASSVDRVTTCPSLPGTGSGEWPGDMELSILKLSQDVGLPVLKLGKFWPNQDKLIMLHSPLGPQILYTTTHPTNNSCYLCHV